MNNRICVIAVGYNRPVALGRLLDSLADAEYGSDQVDILISIDKGQRQKEIVDLAEAFVWKYGDKRVRAFSEKQGLRNHILQCGDISEEYDGVVVLEDDLTVARNYYNFVRTCIDYYGDDPSIAGISLYKHCYNVDAGAFFEPAYDGADVYLMQYAQSWGQCWTKRMWRGFRTWYESNEKIFDALDDRLLCYPINITTWSQHSWLKYYIAYIIENDLFYIYPHQSMTTNHSEAGEHNQLPNCDYQVALPQGIFDYRLRPSDELIKYDAFFERINLDCPAFPEKKLVIDLYGRKRSFDNADYLISTEARPYRVMHEWKLKLRPQELNLLHPEDGKGIYVYDLGQPGDPPHQTDQANIRTRFDVRSISYRKLIGVGLAELKLSLRNKVGKKLKR